MPVRRKGHEGSPQRDGDHRRPVRGRGRGSEARARRERDAGAGQERALRSPRADARRHRREEGDEEMKDTADAILRPEQAAYLEALELPRDALLAKMEAEAAERGNPISDPE